MLEPKEIKAYFDKGAISQTGAVYLKPKSKVVINDLVAFELNSLLKFPFTFTKLYQNSKKINCRKRDNWYMVGDLEIRDTDKIIFEHINNKKK